MKNGIWVAINGNYPFTYTTEGKKDETMKEIRDTVIEAEVFMGHFTETEALEKIYWEKKNDVLFVLNGSNWALTFIQEWVG